MKNIILFCAIIFLTQDLSAQTEPLPVYYSPVNMPDAWKNDYYGQFDTKLLAEDLASLLQKATGKIFTPLAYQPGAVKGIFLLIDSTTTIAGNETGVINSDGKNFIRITARYTTGISYAMYSWLEQLGFHFYLPGDEWTIIPSLPAIFNKKIIDQIYKPYFRLRMFSASGSIFPVKGLDEDRQNGKAWIKWYQRNRMGCDYIQIGGHIGEAFNIAHRKEIEKDSLILASVNGKRAYNVSGKLDPTYKIGVNLFTDWIVDQFKKEQSSFPSFLPFKKYYTVDAGDGLDYCHTPGCEAQFKSVSDQVFSIANEAAKKIKITDARAGVSTLAYGERADTPSIHIEPNVHVMVVPTAFQSTSTYAELMKRWARKSKNISVYEYLNIGVWAMDKPFFNMDQYFNTLQFLKSLNIEGGEYETSLSKFASGIQQYFILKFLCDPYASVDHLLDEFCKNNFGNAVSPVKKLFKEWYFSNVHLQTNYDYPSFYEDELGRFIQYIIEAENATSLTTAEKYRIEELKAYTIYLCKYYELFAELKSLKSYSDPTLRKKKVQEILTYTWQLYSTKIFHNTQLNDMLIRSLNEEEKQQWNYRSSDHFRGITKASADVIKSEFEKVKARYLPMAARAYPISDSFFAAYTKYSMDSIRIVTTDEKALSNYLYPLQFYCAEPGLLKIFYKAHSSQSKIKKGKAAIISVESADLNFIKSDFVYKQNSSGILYYHLPAKGQYKLYLSQYNSTHVTYIIYPGKNLFYHNKKSILMNGLLMQDNAPENAYPNKYLAFYAPPADSIYFSNIYVDSKNTSRFFSATGKMIFVRDDKEKFYNILAVPKNEPYPIIFYQNSQYRWPPVLNNTAPYYFFLKFPLR